MLDHDKNVPRPVRSSDVLVIFIGFLMNLVKTLDNFVEDIYELSIYHSNRKTKENAVWQEMTRDIEKLEEETDGR